MSWLIRLALLAGGVFVIILAQAQIHAGHWVFDNASYRQTTFAAGGYGLGVLLILLACVPPSGWVYRHITTRHAKPKLGGKTKRRRHSDPN